jgi:hypothetical protein
MEEMNNARLIATYTASKTGQSQRYFDHLPSQYRPPITEPEQSIEEQKQVVMAYAESVAKMRGDKDG